MVLDEVLAEPLQQLEDVLSFLLGNSYNLG